MKLHESGEDYLEAIFVLQQKRGMVRSVDVSQHLGVKKPSVCHAVSILERGGLLVKDEDHFLHLTEKGRETAEAIYDVIPHFIYIQIMLYSVELKAA